MNGHTAFPRIKNINSLVIPFEEEYGVSVYDVLEISMLLMNHKYHCYGQIFDDFPTCVYDNE